MPSSTSSKLAPVGALRATLSKNKRLLVAFTVLAGLIILHGAHHTRAIVPQLSSTFGSTKLQDWIPGSSNFFTGTQTTKEKIVHPIPKLMADAQTKFKKMITGQSKTLAGAVKEYKRRHGRNPPKGFDEWFKFAKENGVKMIDEYDQLVRDLEPFWGMSGEELRRRAFQVRGCVLFAISSSHAETFSCRDHQVGHLPSIDLVRLQNGKAIPMKIQKGFNDSEVGARAKGFCAMLKKFGHKVRLMSMCTICISLYVLISSHSYRIWTSLSTRKQKGGFSFHGSILSTRT